MWLEVLYATQNISIQFPCDSLIITFHIATSLDHILHLLSLNP